MLVSLSSAWTDGNDGTTTGQFFLFFFWRPLLANEHIRVAARCVDVNSSEVLRLALIDGVNDEDERTPLVGATTRTSSEFRNI